MEVELPLFLRDCRFSYSQPVNPSRMCSWQMPSWLVQSLGTGRQDFWCGKSRG